MKLYHYTSKLHWPLIQAAGFLKLTESNVGSPCRELLPYGEHFAPDVVWLSDSDSVKYGSHGLVSSVDKTEIRITVDADAEKWESFATRHGINRKWYRLLDATGGYTSLNWYVYEKPIQIPEFIAVDMR